MWNAFARPEANTLTPGPLMMPFDASPNWPAFGAAKADTSNQRCTVRWAAAKLGTRSTSGRRLTIGAVAEVV